MIQNPGKELSKPYIKSKLKDLLEDDDDFEP